MAAGAIEIHHHDSALGAWDVAMRRPHPALRQHVAQLWHGAGQVSYERDRILPQARSYLLINLGPPQYLFLPGPPELRIVFDDIWFSGLHEGPIETSAPHGSVLLGVAFSASGAAALLPWSQAELANRTGPLLDLVGPGALSLRERLLNTASVAQRLDLVEDWLLDTCITGRSVHPLVHWTLARLNQSGGRVRAEELAREAGCSRKYLGNLVGRAVGLPPKSLARIYRFQHALAQIGVARDWALLAADCGYYDQSHLIRDFQQFSGMPPAAFARSAQPDPGSVVVR
ncbi:MAG TPA: helix-turn-helix domain-containing protein [Tahibacter sp.]|uniref:helix-turn-helix domain-containing protein n=1 Tax=Tahibacter sp. TaxID=2056211 RepID=UPI002C45D8DD|nr:helix-turn-helix domain-containing protein [Tahibacter sp.]HSX58973.1 helix-turn-helix domain-containing protein [Tahibacter sp.]